MQRVAGALGSGRQGWDGVGGQGEVYLPAGRGGSFGCLETQAFPLIIIAGGWAPRFPSDR